MTFVPPRLVLFDLDDTLFDHRFCTVSALDRLRRLYPGFRVWSAGELARRHSAILEELHAQVIVGTLPLDRAREERFRRLFEAAGDVPDRATVSACALTYKQAYIDAWRPVPGALPLLEALKGRARLGVVTNNLVQEQEAKLRATGLARFVDVVVISEGVGVAKPDPRIFDIALDRAGCGADEAVMVGDGWRTDIAGALAAGLRAIWVNWDGAAPDDAAADVLSVPALEPVDTLIHAILGPAPAATGHRS